MMIRWKKWMLAAGVWCAVSAFACGCGSADQPEDAVQVQNETVSPEENEDAAVPSEEETETLDMEAPASEDSREEPDLTGNIKEMGNGQCTVTEVLQEETEDGAAIMVSPAEGSDDAGFNKVTVVWTEDTVFTLRTIYDGGARYEDADAKAEDLAADKMIKVWGTYENDILYASKIQIVETVF